MTKTNPFIKRHQEVAEKVSQIKSSENEEAKKLLKELILKESLEELNVDIQNNFQIEEEKVTRNKSDFPLSYDVFYENEHECVKFKYRFPTDSKDVNFYFEVLSSSFPNPITFKKEDDKHQLEIDLKTFIKWEYRNYDDIKKELNSEKEVFSEKTLNPLEFEIKKMNFNIRAYNQSLEALIK
ncbi:hypothetical protein [Aureivirga sp. CE67]|uniref:hypothetical protein n=1 Tax=Aureivirga sp. CE67 TaxID=1788983 RepID=UPI0018CA3C2E|nr:hypothetical protein [Aureivirga sp. CE67]